MNAYYNRNGIGDVLILSLRTSDDVAYSKNGHVVRIFDVNTNQLLGVNFFDASKSLSLEKSGKYPLTLELLLKLQSLYQQAGFKEDLVGQSSFVVGHVVSKEKHPQADKLNVCTVDVGKEVLQIVCGAPNVEAGQKVVVALSGAVMPNGLKIVLSDIRGVQSNGMICSAKELDLPNAPQERGILVLPESEEVGKPFLFGAI